MSQLTVVYVSPHSDFHGADKSLFQNLEYFKQKNLLSPLVILPKEGLLSENLKRAGIPYRLVPFKTSAGGGQSKNQIKTLLKRQYNQLLAIYAGISLAGKSLALVHTNDMITDFGIKLAHVLRLPHIQHGRALLEEQCGIYFDRGEIRELGYINHYSESIVFNSRTVLERYRRYFPESKVHLVYSPVFVRGKLPGEKRGHILQTVRFVFAGRIERAKDPLVALRAVNLLLKRHVKGFDFTFFGSANPYQTEYFDAFVDELKRLPENIVSYKGFDPLLGERLGEFDVGVFSSPFEGVPRAINEFCLNGLPVLAADSGGASELIKHGTNGYLFPPGNAVELSMLMELLIRDHQKIWQLGRRARATVSDEFSVERTSEQLLEIYNQSIE